MAKLFKGVRVRQTKTELKFDLSSTKKAALGWALGQPIRLDLQRLSGSRFLLSLKPEKGWHKSSRRLCHARTRAKRFALTQTAPREVQNCTFEVESYSTAGKVLFLKLHTIPKATKRFNRELPLFSSLGRDLA